MNGLFCCLLFAQVQGVISTVNPFNAWVAGTWQGYAIGMAEVCHDSGRPMQAT